MPIAPFSGETIAKIDDFLRRKVESGKTPALVAGVTTPQGEIYFGHHGPRNISQPDLGPVDQDTIFQMFSATKLVTAVACLQQVEKGSISLDDPEVIERWCPELTKLDICKGYSESGEIILEKPKNRITLRMLLDHTSGLSYDFTAPWLARYRKENNLPHFWEPNAPIDAYIFPLAHEPGTRWLYSIGLDWAGFLLERLLGESLETIFKENIFNPCGITSLSFYPPREDTKMFGLATRDQDGKLFVPPEHPFGRPRNPDQISICSGGGGLFGTPRDYLRFLQHLLASKTPVDGVQPLLSASNFDLLFQNSINRTDEMKSSLVYFARNQHQYDPRFVEDDKAEYLTFGLSLIINTEESAFGRRANSGSWDGAAKTFFWIDPTTGIAGVFCTNLLARNPDPVLLAYNEYERLVYDSI